MLSKRPQRKGFILTRRRFTVREQSRISWGLRGGHGSKVKKGKAPVVQNHPT